MPAARRGVGGRAAEEMLHLVGPGGAGKTTVGPLVAAKLGWSFFDLDAAFMRSEGDISNCIATHGYDGYARRNLAVYLKLRKEVAGAPAVVALSSGFMTYAAAIDSCYLSLRQAIESAALTALLMPSFDLEVCVERIVARQLARPYLSGDSAREEARIRQRFSSFLALGCARFCSHVPPAQLAEQLQQFVRRALAVRMDVTACPPLATAPAPRTSPASR